MSSNLPYKQAANVERRTWDKKAYEAKAKARLDAENVSTTTSKQKGTTTATNQVKPSISGQKRSLAETIINDDQDKKEEFQEADKNRAGPMHSKRAFLKARTSKVDLESKVGTSEIINPEEAAKSSVQITDGVSKVSSGGGGGVGWYCRVCDCYLKDSLTYLDHINGRKHQRALGYSMRTEKSTTEEVSSRLQSILEAKKKEEEERQKEFIISKEDDDDGINEFEIIVKKKDEDIKKRKEERAKRRKERKKKAAAEKNGIQFQNTIPINQDEDNENENLDADDCETEGVDPEMAKMMGFSSFG